MLQGLFGALLQPAALALLRAAFPAEKLNMAIGVWGATIGLSSAAGPFVGGLLVENVSWQSVFFINVPVGIVALIVGILVVKESKAASLSRIDWLGVVLLSGAMFSPDLGDHQGSRVRLGRHQDARLPDRRRGARRRVRLLADQGRPSR